MSYAAVAVAHLDTENELIITSFGLNHQSKKTSSRRRSVPRWQAISWLDATYRMMPSHETLIKNSRTRKLVAA